MPMTPEQEATFVSMLANSAKADFENFCEEVSADLIGTGLNPDAWLKAVEALASGETTLAELEFPAISEGK